MRRRGALLSLTGLVCGLNFSSVCADRRSTFVHSNRHAAPIDELRATAFELAEQTEPSREWADAKRLCREIVDRADRNDPVSAALAQSAADSYRRAIRQAAGSGVTTNHVKSAERLQTASEQFIQWATVCGRIS